MVFSVNPIRSHPHRHTCTCTLLLWGLVVKRFSKSRFEFHWGAMSRCARAEFFRQRNQILCKRTQFSSLVLKYILEEGGGVKDIFRIFSVQVFLPNFFCTRITFWKFPFQYALLNRAACLFLLLPTLQKGWKKKNSSRGKGPHKREQCPFQDCIKCSRHAHRPKGRLYKPTRSSGLCSPITVSTTICRTSWSLRTGAAPPQKCLQVLCPCWAA